MRREVIHKQHCRESNGKYLFKNGFKIPILEMRLESGRTYEILATQQNLNQI